MININEKQVDLEFGTGDIGINGGHFLDGNNNKIGLVGFINQEPRTVGAEGDIKIGQDCKVGDFPVIMTFYRKESIDVVINALMVAKDSMD